MPSIGMLSCRRSRGKIRDGDDFRKPRHGEGLLNLMDLQRSTEVIKSISCASTGSPSESGRLLGRQGRNVDRASRQYRHGHCSRIQPRRLWIGRGGRVAQRKLVNEINRRNLAGQHSVGGARFREQAINNQFACEWSRREIVRMLARLARIRIAGNRKRKPKDKLRLEQQYDSRISRYPRLHRCGEPVDICRRYAT